MILFVFIVFGFFNHRLASRYYGGRDYGYGSGYGSGTGYGKGYGKGTGIDLKTKCAGIMVKNFYAVRENCDECNSKCSDALQVAAQFLNKDQCGELYPEMTANGQKVLKISYAAYQVSCFKNSLWTDVGSVLVSQKPLLIKGLVVAAYVAKALYNNILIPFVDGFGGTSASKWGRKSGFYPGRPYEDEWEEEEEEDDGDYGEEEDEDEEDDEDYEEGDDEEEDEEDDDYEEGEDEDQEANKLNTVASKSKKPSHLKKPVDSKKHSVKKNRRGSKKAERSRSTGRRRARKSPSKKPTKSETIVFKKDFSRIPFKKLNLYDDKSNTTKPTLHSPLAALLLTQTDEADKIFQDYGVTGQDLEKEAKKFESFAEGTKKDQSLLSHDLDTMVTLVEPITNGEITYVNPWVQEHLGKFKDAALVMKIFYPEIEQAQQKQLQV